MKVFISDKDAGDRLGQGPVKDLMEATKVVPVVTLMPPISSGHPPSSGRRRLMSTVRPAPLQSRRLAQGGSHDFIQVNGLQARDF